MADTYTKLARSVDKLLALYGKDCQIVNSIPGGYDPGTGTVKPGGDVTYTARAIEGGYTLENLADTLIETGNKAGIFKITDTAFTGEVALTMKIRLQGDKLRTLREVQPFAPGPQNLYWHFVAGS
jgi:transcription termination factor Rho